MDTVKLFPVKVADLWLPSGKVVACEPDQIEETPPFDVPLPAGRFPVFLRIAQLESPDPDERVATAIIRFAERDVVQWEPASNGRTDDLVEDGVFG